MAYTINVTTVVVDYRSEDGEWLDGDRREIESPDFDTITVESEDIDYDGLKEATLDAMPKGTWEPSVSPIGDELPVHTWLSDSYENPYTGHVTETSVRLTGDFTGKERADIFRAMGL